MFIITKFPYKKSLIYMVRERRTCSVVENRFSITKMIIF